MIKNLADLNFHKIIKYKNISGYNKIFPYECTGFCIDCETKKILKKNEKLTAISHGADSRDYQKLIKKKYTNNIPVMIVFENPGGNEEYGIGRCVEYKGIEKYVPVCHYYWIENDTTKPISNIKELLNYKKYGPYIVYLQEKYNLNNIYVTNLTKCKSKINNINNNSYSNVVENCVSTIFSKEFELFKPKIILCMGGRTFKLFPKHLLSCNQRIYKLIHPAARMSKEKIIKKNDKILKGATTIIKGD